MKRLSKTTFHSHRRLSVKKRTIIIIASSLLALGIATYVVLSIRAWDAQDAVAIQSRDQLKENIVTNLLSDEAKGANNERLTAIITPYEAETKGKAICQLSGIYEWQSTLWFTNERRANCLAVGTTAQKVVEALKALRSTNESLSDTNQSLVAAIAAAQASKSYTDTATIWDTAATTIAAKDGSIKTVTTLVTDISHDISAAYTALEAANKSEDKTQFNTALTSLTAAYARLSEVKTAAVEARQPFITAVTDAYATL